MMRANIILLKIRDYIVRPSNFMRARARARLYINYIFSQCANMISAKRNLCYFYIFFQY